MPRGLMPKWVIKRVRCEFDVYLVSFGTLMFSGQIFWIDVFIVCFLGPHDARFTAFLQYIFHIKTCLPQELLKPTCIEGSRLLSNGVSVNCNGLCLQFMSILLQTFLTNPVFLYFKFNITDRLKKPQNNVRTDIAAVGFHFELLVDTGSSTLVTFLKPLFLPLAIIPFLNCGDSNAL